MLTQQEFLERAKKAHGNKYDYSKTIYRKAKENVIIICHDHGEFIQTPQSHWSGGGCIKCAGKYNPTTEEWIKKAKEIHGDKYDYSLVDYKRWLGHVSIICKEHGVFSQIAGNHLQGQNCPKCANRYNFTTEEWVKKAKTIRGDQFDYSLVKYKNSRSKVTIICKEHGPFEQIANNHLKGMNCPYCSGHPSPSTEEWIKNARKVHGDTYDYSLVDYKNNRVDVTIICKVHGPFKQSPKNHLKGNNCLKCSQRYTHTPEEWIALAKKTHGDLYDYSKTRFEKVAKKVSIICRKHGVFQQFPRDHISGCGCPTCVQSSGEDFVSSILDNLGAYYSTQVTFDECRNTNVLRFDFAIYYDEEKTELAGLIEYQGIFHFMPIKGLGGMKSFRKQQENDWIKQQFCKKNSIPLLLPNYKHTDAQVEEIVVNEYYRLLSLKEEKVS